MARLASGSVVRQLGSLFEDGTVAGLSDRQLLERFIAARDPAGEAAFAAIVARHGPMVLDICRQLLGDLHHAEDAFQAVFLVLARRARSIRDPDLLGNWLYGVALRTARCARAQHDRRRKKEEGDAMSRLASGSSPAMLEPMVQSAEQPAMDREQATALHHEIDRLPRSFRRPVVLCYFEGLTLDEAARRLRCPAGTVRSRLARAREKLRRALTRRGVVVPAAALTAALAPVSTRAAVSFPLCEITTRAAIQFAAGTAVSCSATALAREVLRFMFISNVRFTAFSLVLLAASATGAGFLARGLGVTDDPRVAPAAAQPPVIAKPADANLKATPGRMFVVGRVLDPQGKPVPGATVVVSARAKLSGRAVGLEGMTQNVIGETGADGSGRFSLDSPRTSSTRNDEFMAIALAPGYGVGWAAIDPDADQPTAEISLHPEQVIQGRLFDLQGRPAQGVVVSVSSIERLLVTGDPLPGRFNGPAYWWARVNDIPAWPKPATSDADGRFELHGVGRRLQTQLNIIDSRFASQMIEVKTDDALGAKSVTMALQPAKIFTGRVTYADTGKPVPHARLQISASGAGQRGSRPTYSFSDDDGRFRANPAPGDLFFVFALPPARQQYLGARKRVDWPKGAVEQSVDLALPRGVVIRGKVTEDGSKAPIAGASVTFVSKARPNADSNVGGGQSETATDGSFELAVPPGAGHLAIHGPSEDYVLREIGNNEFFQGQSGGRRLYAHSFTACDPKSGGTGVEVNVALRRGATVSGVVVGPDDQPVEETWIIGRAAIAPGPAAWRFWRGDYHGNAVNGRFELHGLDRDTVVSVYFLQPTRKLGAMSKLSGMSAAGGPVTIRLEPCGTAIARLVDASGRPLPRYRDVYSIISMVVTPGPDPAIRQPGEAKRLVAETESLTRIDSINYAKAPESDAEGRITFPALIPGASYRIVDRTTFRDPSGPKVRKDFIVGPGETLYLGDIPIEKPQER